MEIEPLLKNADESWFAVALIKDKTFEYIQNTINESCIQHYIVGIDLPTPPSVLHSMQAKQEKKSFECAIYKSDFNFHPKVYLIKSNDEYVAFVGSANLTDGGFENNVELNYKISNQADCLHILNWFNSLFKDGYPLTDENIDEYESQLESIKETEKELKRKRKSIVLKKTHSTVNPLDAIDFSDRFFKKEHHWAFRRELWYSDSEEAVDERELARSKCIELHEIVFPRFKDYGIQILEPNPMSDHLISMIRLIDPSKPRAINAMWLSYGKNVNEIKEYQKLVGPDQKAKQTFIHHARLQIRIDVRNIGIWLLFAKENEGGLFDREFFKGQMRDRTFRDKFYQMIKSLPNEYFISVGGVNEFCNKFTSPEVLHNFTKKDNNQMYFIIGRDYEIQNDEMSETNMPSEMLTVFKLLFPFYEMMRHRI
ncbi:phospholipase D family protein [Allomuricauda sp. F6463D]|uniref:phospholipase D family protein n=1 Tax=Allomuricauda sp. F6463D TaxID=2926409 RepID=UPI001FF22F16|nr:phospholipase D family protein [Muricauda sp. F6463D]MCK0160498.1 phospholipase D family protein [Muricauda sp. F6463D]